MDRLWVYDNSTVSGPLQLVLASERGEIRFLADPLPDWCQQALATR